MEASTLSSIKELGIAIVAVLAIGVVAVKLLQQMQKNQTDYTSFVNENNHQKTEMIQEHTQIMVQVKNTLETHLDVLKEIRDDFRRMNNK